MSFAQVGIAGDDNTLVRLGTKGLWDKGTKGQRDKGTKGRRDGGTEGRRDAAGEVDLRSDRYAAKLRVDSPSSLCPFPTIPFQSQPATLKSPIQKRRHKDARRNTHPAR